MSQNKSKAATLPAFCNVADYKKIEKFVLPITEGFIYKVYDGDTAHFTFELEGKIYRSSVRFLGIDCPEKKIPKSEQKLQHRISEARLNEIATARVEELMLNKLVHFTDNKTEMYGRLLANIHVDTEEGSVCVNKVLLEERMAVPYMGKKKNVPNDWMEYYEGREEYPPKN